MAVISYGDMASYERSTSLSAEIRKNIDDLSYEISSGEKTDISQAISGDFGPLAAIERSLRTLESYELSVTEADLFATGMQTTMEYISNHTSESSASLFSASTAADNTSISVTAKDARSRLDSIVSSLNTSVSGRSLFSGAATGSDALASSQDMMDDITLAITTAGATTAEDIKIVVDDWFDSAGGGFETIGYLGSDNNISPFSLSENETASLEITASNTEIRSVLKGFAMASLVNDNIPAVRSEQAEMLRLSGEQLMSAEADIANIRAHIGTIEAQISDSETTNQAQTYAFEMAKSDIISADIYESAALLTQAETQLETFYTLTARLSRLSLTDYL